jgi:hypothetical protein
MRMTVAGGKTKVYNNAKGTKKQGMILSREKNK